MSALAILFRGSRRIGFAPTVVCALAALAFGAVVARAAVDISFLWQIPMLGMAVEFVLITIVGIGGLVTLWLITDHVEYLRRGYRMRWTSGNEWLYEERVSKIAERSLPCVRIIVGKGYPAACEVRVLSEASWESEAPLWARGRRAEIIQRIAGGFGADHGGSVRFLDQ